ncbi:hypothetical protein LX15_000203 [Streptoalloteichus tenebrarius]|uniref:Uncharacterized protein n=1 Tax=Streptoalloteichus tenebrarius (strain ATCC 17920 / DSM 40477 / JCM 4838 / CBS 697.72 / NBRC 16177 / NCIMB 11028 / NRRL B-12390 / A12253. 1 / ISP 5477) TaxID=1933 RepID=A0ABT1HLY9_STRSD|nr:hypothetical protein [Streptoalloteichus tenebrarius]MCP2256520.1 hypothetical protein [Streptoalloteichus tenebrarius]BFF04871.1 hypothetical protein GCM10020241_65460 [Streptoalloteichus tenebrarius]
MGFPVPGVKIFPSRPPATEDTFRSGIPLQGSEDQARAIILYTPDLQIIGSIDNTNSDAETVWSRSVTTGFTFRVETSISVSVSAEVNVEFVKAGLTVTSSLTFSSEWSKSVTDTMQFSVPAKARVFTYQGYIWSEILTFDTHSQQYGWSNEGPARCLTNVLATSRDPLPIT